VAVRLRASALVSYLVSCIEERQLNLAERIEREALVKRIGSCKAMIEIDNETLIPIREAPRLLPRRPNGRRVHISACYRWIQRGVRGVRLEAIRIGGTMYTAVEALERFGLRLSCEGSESHLLPESSTRKRQVNQASQRLRNLLGSTTLKEKSRESGRGQTASTPKQ